MSDLLRILAILGLVAANAFFVGEYAVVTARRSRLAQRVEAGSRGAAAALRLMDDPVRVISTVQIGITAIGILTGAIGEPLVRDLLGGDLPSWLSFLVAFAIVTYVTVVLGELVPKALALDRGETLAVLVARPIELIGSALRPLAVFLQQSARFVLLPLGIRNVVAGEQIRTPEELRAAVDEAEQAGVIARSQEELLHNVFDFAAREAAELMVPASQVAWLDADLSPAAAVDPALHAAHTRFVVARGSLDRVVGVVHVRDVVVAARDRRPATVAQLARPAFVVPETKDVGALLRELRERREQIAVVADEYGRTLGIVTLEDVLEEIVGEIEDEYDLPDATVRRIDEHVVEVAGSMTIDDFNETLGTRLPDRGPRTLAGLVFEELGRRPQIGDSVTIDGVALTVHAVEDLRIAALRVVVP